MTAEDRAWFDAYVAEHPKMAPRDLDALKVAPVPSSEVSDPPSSDDAPPPTDPTAEPTDPKAAAPTPPPPVAKPRLRLPAPPRAKIPPPPRMEAPPKFDLSDAPPSGAKNANTSGRWQDQYTPKSETGKSVHPREFLCVEIAKVWLGITSAFSDLLVAVGGKPIVPPQAMGAAYVLAVDELLPPNLDLSPAKMAIVGTGVLAGQCLVNYKPIRAEIKRRNEALAHESELDRMKRHTAEAEARHKASEAQASAARAAAAQAAYEASPKQAPIVPRDEPEDLLDTDPPQIVAVDVPTSDLVI